MGIDLEALERSPSTRGSGIVLAIACATVTMVAASLLIRTGPTEGYRAGYGAVIAKGEALIRAEVDLAGGYTLNVCDRLLSVTTGFATQSYSDFVEGCAKGIDDLSGRHVPLFDAHAAGTVAG